VQPPDVELLDELVVLPALEEVLELLLAVEPVELLAVEEDAPPVPPEDELEVVPLAALSLVAETTVPPQRAAPRHASNTTPPRCQERLAMAQPTRAGVRRRSPHERHFAMRTCTCPPFMSSRSTTS
jgi:hypothetical protein